MGRMIKHYCDICGKEMQSKIDKPMKKFKNKKFGEYGNVFDLEKVFESGYIPKHRGH
jgi:hypothetical protein